MNWYTPIDLRNNTHTERKITKNIIKNPVPKETILMSSRAPIGYIGIANEACWHSQGIKGFLNNEEIILNKYFYYWIQLNINKIKRLGTGSTFKEVSSSILKSITINIPPKSVQQKIIDIIEPFEFTVKTANDIEYKLLNAIEQSYKLSNKTAVNLGDIADVNLGGTPSTKNKDYWTLDGYPWLNSGKLTNTMFSKPADKFLSNDALSKTKIAKKNSILLSIIEPDKNKISIATEDTAVNQSIAIITSEKNLFLPLRASSKQFALSKSGSAQQSINKTIILNTKIFISDNQFDEEFKLLRKLHMIEQKANQLHKKLLKLLIK